MRRNIIVEKPKRSDNDDALIQKQSKEIHDLKKQLLNVEQVGEENHDLRAQLSTMIKENEGLKAQFVLVEKEKQGLHDEILAVAKEHSDCQAQLVVDSTLLDRCGVKFDEAEARMAGNDDLILKLHKIIIDMELKAANASIDEANFAKRNEEITLSMAEYVRYVSEYCAKKLQMAENNYAEL